MKVVRCAQDRGEEKCPQVRCDRLENVRCDQMVNEKSNQVKRLIDKIQCDQVCRPRGYTSPTSNTTEQDRHPNPNSHTLTTIGENGLLKKDNTVLSTALRGGKSTGPPQGSDDQYKEYQETKPQPHTKHTHTPSTNERKECASCVPNKQIMGDSNIISPIYI